MRYVTVISRAVAVWLGMIVLAGCDIFNMGGGKDPFSASLCTLTIFPVFPEGFGQYSGAGIVVTVGDIDKGHKYETVTGEGGTAMLRLPVGNYRVIVNEKAEEFIFNGSADNVILDGADKALKIDMVSSRKGEIVIKEIYCGGCQAYPLQGRYSRDSYVILHNNSSKVQYLDNLCFGTLDPYNAGAVNVWTDSGTGASISDEFVPVIQAVWKIGGDGSAFPLGPGEDAVISVYGAIDHTITYEQSVNLDNPVYFVCYDNVLFPNTKYHPAPGPGISLDRYLQVVIKTGQSNAYTFSVTSPAVVIFRAQGQTIEDFVEGAGNVVQKPGSTVDRVVKVPVEWILDGVEVFTGNTVGNTKRLGPAIDAGFIPLSAPYLRHTLHRYTDVEETEARGYEVLMDSNNSSRDFYERNIQSLNDRL